MSAFDRLRSWVFGGSPRPRPSVLRQFFNPSAPDLAAELDRCAVLVRESGQEHLVTEVTLAEIEALVRAGAVVAKRRAVILVDALRDPAAALAPFDGGETKAKQTLDWARRAPVELG